MTTQELKQSIEKVLGNNIRCLLPSYWWKRLFNQVADRIDEVEQSTSELIEASKMPIVESESNLSQLDLPKGSVAAVVEESVTVKISDCYFSETPEEDWEKYTIVKRVEEKANITIDKDNVVAFSASKDWLNGDFQVAALDSGIFVYLRYIDGHYIDTTLSEVNEALSSGKYRATLYENAPDDYFTFYSEIPQPELYIKGDSWERFAKESDLDEVGGGVVVDSEMSDTSTNAVQNKVIKTALEKIAPSYHNNGFRDFIVQTGRNEGSNKKPRFSFGETTNNATYIIDATVYGQKLDGNNELFMEYNLNGKSYKRLYNAITGVLISEEEIQTDTSNLATKQELNAKQDVISDLETIRSGAALGATALQEHQDISHLATKEELTSLTNEIIANEEVHAGAYNDLNTRLNELSENVQGETVTKEEFNAAIEGVNNGISAKQDVLVSGTNIKTLNGESILGEGNIVLNVDTSSLATKEELESLTNEVITNEEVVAAAFNEINERINEAVLEVDNKIASSITNAINASY